jgi:beta-glucosidase
MLTITVDVTNSGQRAGKESVLLFSSDLVASMVPDCRRLRAFEKIALQPGQTRTVSFCLPAADLAFVDYQGSWTLEAGDFVFSVDKLAAKVLCTDTYVWDTPNR